MWHEKMIFMDSRNRDQLLWPVIGLCQWFQHETNHMTAAAATAAAATAVEAAAAAAASLHAHGIPVFPSFNDQFHVIFTSQQSFHVFSR